MSKTIKEVLFKMQDESFAPFNNFTKGVIDKEECIKQMVKVRDEALAEITRLLEEAKPDMSIDAQSYSANTLGDIRKIAINQYHQNIKKILGE